jgi:uncharacterized protein YdbL (DUF1318 family)
MKLLRLLPLLPLLLVSACVTVNIFFPAEAAESAARVFTRDVYGPEAAPAPAPSAPPAAPDTLPPETAPAPGAAPQSTLDWLITPARAQTPDLDLSSPRIQALKAAMAARHPALAPHYASGAVGIGGDGLLVLRDPAAVPLAARHEVNLLIGQENRQRAELYREIARANGNPAWEPRIRAIWASQWIANAPAGTWFQQGGQWTRK